ncbi:hypothetical protein FJT64_026940 [Amphibalanus amphitrite]|uniref:Uncharacterized protein n=1 Tax=Amphibalanus amphitrite TaxID=1232801 RepID=A0A6A4W038_AMPAM|nr:hypothetical protein FJT64_026940 [Amphibalanus amphitrite]
MDGCVGGAAPRPLSATPVVRQVGVYLPALDELGGQLQQLEPTLNSYVSREFPLLHSRESVVYSLPSVYIPSEKHQASEAERIVFELLRGLHAPGLGVLFFHGRHYAGRTAKHTSGSNLITREHDYVVLVRYHDRHFILLAEVKSTSDSQSEMLKTSNAREVKDQKRSALNQLRRHREVLAQQLNIGEECIPGFILWPFLCGRSVDVRTNQTNARWQAEDFHLFCDTLASSELFNRWFVQRLACTPDLPLADWNKLLHRFLLLSCGASVRELGGELDFAMSQDMDRTVALLSVTQHRLLHSGPQPLEPGTVHPLVIQGAAGTGKTLIMMKKIEMLHNMGQLGPDSQALFLCYWPGIRMEVVQRLQRLGIEHVVTQRISISNDWFVRWCRQQSAGFRHVFVDELESVLISPLCAQIVDEIAALYVRGNAAVRRASTGSEPGRVNGMGHPLNGGGEGSGDSGDDGRVRGGRDAAPEPRPADTPEPMELDAGCCGTCHTIRQRTDAAAAAAGGGGAPGPGGAVDLALGHFWVSVDENQRTVPAVFRSVCIPPEPHLRLTSVYRSTRNVFNLFRSLCDCAADLSVAHAVDGPPVFWVDLAQFTDNTAAVAALVVDLTGAKGFQPCDICVMPFFDDNSVDVEALNGRLRAGYQPGSLVPQAVRGVEALLEARDRSLFCVTWLLRMKGLECPVVVLVLPAEDVDVTDVLDQRKLYTMMSRCTCLLLLLSHREVVSQLDPSGRVRQYCFSEVTLCGAADAPS